jgi:acyl-coenzyme A thioesterase PaaI-like protein
MAHRENPASIPSVASWHCFGCGPGHPKGLRLRFTTPGPDTVRSEVTVSDDYTGFASIVHGGIVATIFDEVMMWCLMRHRRRFFVTKTMAQELLRPAMAGVPLVAEARVDGEDEGRFSLSTTLVTAADPGTILARGSGWFTPLPARLLSVVPDDLREDMEALFATFAAEDEGRPGQVAAP